MKFVIAIPVLNEESVLRRSVETIRRYLASSLAEHQTVIVIADNGSDDRTEEIGRALAAEHPDVRYLRLDKRGKGLAIRTAWSGHDAAAYVFMDVDLSTDLEALRPLVRAIEEGADLAVGSRFHAEAKVERSRGRKAMSLGYRWLLKTALGMKTADAPCGFKAASARLVRELLPAVRDDRWFFDTELVVRAERGGYRIAEIPVVWRDFRKEGRRSKVAVFSLITEYTRRVAGLRRELGKGSGRGEWAVVAASAFAKAITTVPILYGLWIAGQKGLVWNGRSFLSPGDFAVYLSYIDQVKSGALTLENHFTTEPLMPVLNVLWLGVGLLARALDLSALATFHLGRVLLIPGLVLVSYAFIAWLFADRRSRLVAFLLFMFGSGWGIFFAPLFSGASPGAGRYEWPIDLWVAESNTFLTMLYSPHFIASLTLLLASIWLLCKAFGGGRPRHAVGAGIAALALFQFHPFHAPTLYAVPAAFLVWRLLGGHRDPRRWFSYAIFVAISLPSVAYHYYLTHYDERAQALLDANLTITPAIWHLMIGFGAVSVLAWIGYRRAKSNAPDDWRWDFLAIWAVVQTLLVYAPFPFQRRLLEGLQFPLVMLSVPAITAAYARVVRDPRYGKAFAHSFGVLLACALFLPSTVAAFTRSINAYKDNNPPIFFFTKEEDAALRWIRRATSPDAVVLGHPETGNIVGGWAARRVYAGHWVNTIDLGRKSDEITRFFSEMGDDERLALLRDHGITHVVVGPRERDLGGTVTVTPFLREVYHGGGIRIYETHF